MRWRGRQDHHFTTELLTDQTLLLVSGHQCPAAPVEMETKAVIETETQLPFAVDQAVLEQVAEFFQQQASMEQSGPPDGGGGVPAAIDF